MRSLPDRRLYEQAENSTIDAGALDEENYVEDYLMIERVHPCTLWFEGHIGPVKVPKAASDVAQPGWSVNSCSAERATRGKCSKLTTSTPDGGRHCRGHATAAIVMPSAVAAVRSASSPATTTTSGSPTRLAAARCTAS